MRNVEDVNRRSLEALEASSPERAVFRDSLLEDGVRTQRATVRDRLSGTPIASKRCDDAAVRHRPSVRASVWSCSSEQLLLASRTRFERAVYLRSPRERHGICFALFNLMFGAAGVG